MLSGQRRPSNKKIYNKPKINQIRELKSFLGYRGYQNPDRDTVKQTLT